jgi:hypothetical protein
LAQNFDFATQIVGVLFERLRHNLWLNFVSVFAIDCWDAVLKVMLSPGRGCGRRLANAGWRWEHTPVTPS